ncbi:MAG: methylmalonyl-CoA epimerase [bacterium]|nr:methylmalonyl-CoA epimerase [bacterium]
MSELPFRILQIDHIGIATSSKDPLAKFFATLGIPNLGSETIADQHVVTEMHDVSSIHLEVLNATDEESPIAKFIAKKGEGFHHLAFRVDNLEAALAYLSSQGIQLIDTKPRKGAGGKLIAFLHPKSTGGILVELSQIDHA